MGEREPEQFEPLLEAAREGSEDAWSAIYRRLAPPVLGYLRASAAPEPEDNLSEVFLQVARDLPRFEGDERDFRAWVFTIAHHRLIDARRADARRPVEPVAETPEPHATPTADVADEAMARIGREEVQRVLAALTPEQQTVLLLRVLGELTVEEVAEAIGKRPGAVKALQRRGLAAVRRKLARGGVTL
ncbi:MAG TPA: RNA polymerase sigma factor [Solirubrobacterales bacterium]|nr:RNA polymerase sigma factor [Solirubrobacterales bacterium]